MANYIIPDPKDPAYQLLIGNPSESIQATKTPRIVLFNAHATEHLAVRVMHYIQTKRKDLLAYVDYICGNPQAAAAVPQQRYTEGGSDLNRSFRSKGEPKTYEEKRAFELIPKLDSYNYVLDLHTTTTTAGSSKRFGIVLHPDDPIVQSIIAASPVERVVVFKGDGGYLPDVINATGSFEYNQEFARTPEAIGEMIETIDVLTGNKKPTPKPREFFYIDRPILRAEDPGIDTPNLELCKDGYYPVLLGDNSYRKDPTKPYVGFAATRKETILL